MRFKTLERKHPESAKEFLETLNMLPIFLNYYPEVRDKWMKDIGLKKRDISRVNKVVSKYAEEKVKLENKKKPKNRKDVILIEDEVLKNIFEAKLIKIHHSQSLLRTSKEIIKQEYSNCAIIEPEQMDELESMLLMEGHKKRFPMDFLVFDPKNMKIIGVEVISEDLDKEVK